LSSPGFQELGSASAPSCWHGPTCCRILYRASAATRCSRSRQRPSHCRTRINRSNGAQAVELGILPLMQPTCVSQPLPKREDRVVDANFNWAACSVVLSGYDAPDLTTSRSIHFSAQPPALSACVPGAIVRLSWDVRATGYQECSGFHSSAGREKTLRLRRSGGICGDGPLDSCEHSVHAEVGRRQQRTCPLDCGLRKMRPDRQEPSLGRGLRSNTPHRTDWRQ